MRNICWFIFLIIGTCFSQNTTDYAFNFSSQKTSEAGIHLTSTLPYNAAIGYGFDFGTAYKTSFVKQGLLASGPIYFSVNLPEGTYKVTLILSGKNTETTVKAESKRLFIPRLKIDSHKRITTSFVVNVFNSKIAQGYDVALKDRELGKLDWDHKLTLEFLGNSILESLKIEQVNGLKTLFLAGDSTVTNQDVEPWASWGQFITAYLDDNIAVSNQASSGASLASFRGSRIDKILSRLKPGDFVIIEFGHNDEKIKGEGTGAWGLYTEIMTDFIKRIKEKEATPILISPTQRRSFDGKNLKPTHGDFPDAMRKVAENEGVTLIDLTQITTQMYEAWGPQLSRKAFVQYAANIFPGQTQDLEDNTHFSNFGANEIALAVANAIRNSDSELKKYIASETPDYNPSQPNSAGSYTIPFSSRFQIEKPDGN
ncbi:lysophospholipase L1-like esterase [Leeuwenhoekiella aestuarii]|uniref:Lysophospholipase L1-like esterase n=1 Tax=Leeuwenhoekiella aestuarii TaxID=2249426 RepID=A0A4Q0NRE4_9FLAO|nr:rhamnogalacturonan acetylesterase [Leeuwenhoekiella aestuarii]RXG13170.1 lysophospholipase L1-like esterase [Leeuwenhoekiella aestuarii]RXG15094.1 lysophospholipase L1-like esterase [Leeuwenhoekiella aestuarii]